MVRRVSKKQRIWFGVVAVLAVIAAGTVPGLAAPTGAKNFSFTVSPGSVDAGTQDQEFTVTVTNTSPRQSSSNISSLSVTVPSQFALQGAVIDDTLSDNPNASAVVAIDSQGSTCQGGTNQTVNVCSADPVKRLQTIALTITVDVTDTGLSCGSSPSDAWLVTGNTGSQLKGDAFVEKPVNPAPTTMIDFACALDWVQAPVNALVGTDQTVTVGAFGGAGIDEDFGGAITIVVEDEPASGALTVTPLTPTAVAGQQSFTLNGDATGGYRVSATATGWGDAPDASFTLFAGDINCGETREDGDLTRGENKDGSQCIIVDYTYEATGFGDGDIDNDLVTLEWDTVLQQGASFRYTKQWDPEAVSATTGLPTRVTQLAWQKDTNGDWIFEPGRACWDDELPTLTATLDGGIDATQTSITVAAELSAPDAPFDVMIGNERLSVTAKSGSTWTVVRGVGGTTAEAHDDDSPVMSTPLPLDDDGNLVPMCIAQEGWTAYGQGLVRFTTTVFDIGDGAMKR